MTWITLGKHIATIDQAPELYDVEGQWVEILRDPPDPKPYEQVELAAEVIPGKSYWYMTEDLTTIAVHRLRVMPGGGCLQEPWLRVSKGLLAPSRRAARIRRAFALAGADPESAPQFLRSRLVRTSTA